MSYILLWIIICVEITLGKENSRNSKNKEFSFCQNWRFLDTILHAGELSEVGDIMNFQILLMEKYKTVTDLCRLMGMIQTFHQAFMMD
jgi:hypothetical protein